MLENGKRINIGSISIMAFLSLFIIIGALFAFSEYQASNWNKASGFVITSEIKHSLVHHIKSGNSYYEDRWSNEIVYKYQYNGKDYTGKCCDVSSSSKAEIAEMANKNKVNSTVMIMVNPSTPSESRLKSDIGSSLLFSLVFMVFPGLILIAYIYFMFIRTPEQPPQDMPKVR